MTSCWNSRKNTKLLSHNLISPSWRLAMRILKVSMKFTTEVQMRSQANKQGQYQQGNWPQFPKQQYQKPNNGQKSYQGNQFRTGSNQGYKPQYQQGSKPYQGSRPQYNQGYQGQGQSQGQGIQQPRIDFGMVLPTQWGLE